VSNGWVHGWFQCAFPDDLVPGASAAGVECLGAQVDVVRFRVTWY